MRKQALLVPLVVVALVAVGIAGAMLTAESAASKPAVSSSPGDQSITVSSEGRATATPDRTVVRVAVTATGEDTESIRNDLATQATALRTALADATVSPDQLSTTNYRIDEHRRHEKAPERPTYRGVHAFEIRLTDTNATGTVIDAATTSGAEVTDVRFTLSDQTRTALRDQALTRAMTDARSQAETLATAGNLSVTGVATIDATDRGYTPVSYDAARTAGMEATETSIETGEAAVSVDVRVVYNATDT